jgi:hypothetical protein
VLSAAETQAVSALLPRVWGPGREIRAAAPIWKRRHVIRLQVGADRSVVLKRRGDQDGSFGVELAAPALARPDSARVVVPEWWQPGL